MGLFGSRKAKREADEKADAIEIFHITALMKGSLSEEELSRLEKEAFGMSLRELTAKGRKLKFLLPDEDGRCWSALGKGVVPSWWVDEMIDKHSK